MKVAISPVTVGRLSLCYALFTAVVVAPLTFLNGYRPVSLLITGALVLFFAGRGIYMLRLRRKPLSREVHPDSIVSRYIVGKGWKFAIVTAVITVVALTAAVALLSLIFDGPGESAEFFREMSFIVPLAIIKESDNYIMEYLALCNYYSGKGTDRIKKS